LLFTQPTTARLYNHPMHSYLTHLECTHCAARFDPFVLQTICSSCNAPLATRYDLHAARRELDREQIRHAGRGMWRWAGLLPVQNPENVISLGEGDTPTLRLTRLGTGLEQLWVKDESFNPTGSFKARGLAAAVSRARELGVQRLIVPTAGNAGGAMAAYAASAGLPACVVMPTDTPRANIEECRAYAAEVVLVDGLISDAGKLAAELARTEGWFDLSTFKEPYRLEGKKVMGYEIAEAFDWRLPDVIIYPTGGGTGLVGIWKAFEELAALGWLESPDRPRMVAVQAAGCAPVVRAFERGAETTEFWEGAQTAAAGLRVPGPFAGSLILRVLRESGGTALSVSEEAIRAAQARLAAQEGVFAAPEGAATLAGLDEMLQRGMVGKEEKVLLLNTGTGLKYL
jgi:threonine synthase